MSDNIIFALSYGATAKPIVQVYNNTNSDAMHNPSSTVLSNSVWTHIAAILRGNNITIYVNCTLTNSEIITTLPRNIVRTNNYIGKSNWIYDNCANAKFRNVRIYNRALSQSELRTDFNNQ